ANKNGGSGACDGVCATSLPAVSGGKWGGRQKELLRSKRYICICETEVATLGLRFNAKKSAVLQLAGSDEAKLNSLVLNGEQAQVQESYKYLGVVLTNKPEYLSDHYAHLRQAAVRGKNVLRKRNLWSCNRFLLTRELWKAVVVPGLTFANAVLCVPGTVREVMERPQREVGRQALGCHGMVATEAVQGDLEWSSFEAREATSKITYDSRLRLKDRGRWAKKLLVFTYLMGVQTGWRKRLYQLENKYDFFSTPVTITSDRKWEMEIRNRVREEEAARWAETAKSNSTGGVWTGNPELALAEALGFGSASSSVADSAGGTNGNNNDDAKPITNGGWPCGREQWAKGRPPTCRRGMWASTRFGRRRLPRPKALAILREMLQTQIDQAYDSSAERFLSDKLSPQCSLKLLEFVHALQNFKPGTLRLDPQQFNSTLNLVTQNYENGTVDLIWLPDEAPFNDSQDNISLHHNNIVHITLAGYSLTLKSAEETVKTTLEASTKKHRLTLLKPWTEYEVILRPFYTKTGKTNEKYKIGKASTTKFRFPAAVNPQKFNSTLNLVTQKYENGTVDLIWLPDEAPFNDSQDNISWHYNNSVHITLAGYFLTLKSAEETVKTTLEASTKKHRFTSLKPWTEYEVILRPFYTKTGKTNEKYKIGKASTTKFRSPAAAQPRPVDVKAYFWGLSPREVYLNVSDSPNRHGERFGHRVRWKLHGDGTSVDGDGQADFGIDGTYFETENWLHINLPPGRLYTLYISALNKGLNDTVIAGEELEIEVATVPPANVITSFTRNIYEAADKRETTLQYFGAPNLVNGEGYGPSQQSITSEKD
ncbi:hypothetical protein HPB47_001940, partial [Ixodes persulcatus]